MFSRLVQKELLHHLLDFRFAFVFALCVLLSALSVYVGSRNYLLQLREYTAVVENHRLSLQGWLETGNLLSVDTMGMHWNRRPEVLSPVVYGLSGVVGQEVQIRHQWLPHYEGSLFATDPVHALFGVLDLAFIVKVVLSLCVLLMTYDAVCGEKEAGTLRLYASFPVARSTMALAKLVGSTVAVLVPFAFSFLLVCLVLALSPDVGLEGEDWVRIGGLMGVFALYLVVFAAFGLWGSALTHRRMVAFLGLLGLWTVWLFILPDVASRTAESLVPVRSIYNLEKASIELRWEIKKQEQDERDAYWRRHVVGDWDALPPGKRQELRQGIREIRDKWNLEQQLQEVSLHTERKNQVRQRRGLTMALSAISPLGAVTYTSMDLARTGILQQERIENAVADYRIYLGRFVQEKKSQEREDRILTDLSPFMYRDRETVGACLSRNALRILNLALLAVLGFAGAYVAILRYDVR